jgi:transcriptional regulator with XRE-family HTH domain
MLSLLGCNARLQVFRRLRRADRIARRLTDFIGQMDRSSGRDRERAASLLIGHELSLRSAEHSLQFNTRSGDRSRKERVARNLEVIQSARKAVVEALRTAALDDEIEAALETLREGLYPTEPVDLEIDREQEPNEEAASKQMDLEEETFANRLDHYMKTKRISQVELATAIGVGQPAISMMLSRNCRPQRRTVERLARALEVPPNDLWPGFGSPDDAQNPGDGQGRIGKSTRSRGKSYRVRGR